MEIIGLEKQFVGDLIDLYDEGEVKILFEMALLHVLNLPKAKLMLLDKVDNSQAQNLLQILKELQTGKPIQHILKSAHFYGFDFKVNKHTLIPRPETEELVEWVSETINKNNLKSVLDVGTGSGCIPITIQKFNPAITVSAIDISKEALKIASENNMLLNTNVNFIEADILNYSIDAKYDVIISNPPYIRDLEKVAMHENVLKYEPDLALFVTDDNPLVFYKAITDFALKNLSINGCLFFEINEYLGRETVDMIKSKGFKYTELRKDMQGKDRMVLAKLEDETA